MEGEDLTEDDWLLAARITARFSKGRNAPRVTVRVAGPGEEGRLMEVAPLAPEEVPQEWYV